jgi:hypothetical protein
MNRYKPDQTPRRANGHQLTSRVLDMAKARSQTIRRKIINLAAKVVRHARTITLRLPQHWPWQQEWQTLFTNTHAPPAPG